jgi:hypothetical protein
MKHRVVGLFSRPWREDLTVSAPPARNPLKMYHWAVWYKANPRGEGYLRALFKGHYPEGEFINIENENDWNATVVQADEVVLLYPDAIGLGFTRLEREVKRQLKPWAGLRVINGRRRNFRLGASTLLGLRLRRIVERAMLGEVLAILVFLLATPVLVVKDWWGGRS